MRNYASLNVKNWPNYINVYCFDVENSFITPAPTNVKTCILTRLNINTMIKNVLLTLFLYAYLEIRISFRSPVYD